MTWNPDILLAFLRHADRLEAFPRTGYVLSRVPAPETIAAHCHAVSLTAMVLADAIGARDDPPFVDRARVLEMAALHDIGEAITTDIPTPVKDFQGRDATAATERRAVARVLQGLDKRYLALWDEYEDGVTLEARIVRAADKIQLLVKVSQYGAAGFNGVNRFWANASNLDDQGIPEARTILDRLQAHRNQGDWPCSDWE